MENAGIEQPPRVVLNWLGILCSQDPPLHVPKLAHLPRTCLTASHTQMCTHTCTQSSHYFLHLGRKELSVVKLVLVFLWLYLPGCWGREEGLRDGLGQGSQTHFHRGMHQLQVCLQRAKWNFRNCINVTTPQQLSESLVLPLV